MISFFEVAKLGVIPLVPVSAGGISHYADQVFRRPRHRIFAASCVSSDLFFSATSEKRSQRLNQRRGDTPSALVGCLRIGRDKHLTAAKKT